MRTKAHRTIQLGDLVAAAFDEAALFSSDPKEITNMAAQAVMRVLWRSKNFAALRCYRLKTLRREAHLHSVGH